MIELERYKRTYWTIYNYPQQMTDKVEEKAEDPKKHIKVLKAAYKQEAKKNTKLQKEILGLTEELNSLKAQLQEKEPDQNDADGKDKEAVAELENALKTAQAELEEYKKSAKSFEEAQSEHRQDFEDCKKQLEQLTIRNADMMEKNRQLEELVDAHKEKLQEAEKQVKGLSKEKSDTKATKLQAELERLRNECANYKKKLEQKEKDMKEVYENSTMIKNELNKQLVELESEVKNKERAIMSKEGEITNLKSAMAEDKAMVHSLTEENT